MPKTKKPRRLLLTLKNLKMFTMSCEGFLSIHSLTLEYQFMEAEDHNDTSTPKKLPHLEAGERFEIAVHRWLGQKGSDQVLSELGHPGMENVYKFLKKHPEWLQ